MILFSLRLVVINYATVRCEDDNFVFGTNASEVVSRYYIFYYSIPIFSIISHGSSGPEF